MGNYSLSVKTANFEFEAHAETPQEVRSMIDDLTEKYLSEHAGYQEKKLKSS